MTDDYDTVDRDARIAERQAGLNDPQTGGNLGRYIGGGIFFVLVAIAAVALLVPDQLSSLFGFGTSDVEEMQREDTTDAGIQTDMTLPGEEAPPVEAMIIPTIDDLSPPAPLEPSGPSEEELARIAELEALIAELEARETGISPEELQELLDAQALDLERALQEQRRLHELELAALRDQGPTAEELAAEEARRRAAEERARLEAIRQEQIQSEALLFDESQADQAIALDAGDGSVRELNDNESFLAAAARTQVETARATSIANPSRTIVQGTILQATLETAMTTDLPGMIRAVLTQDVWSYDGSNVLLPSGSRLIGTYSSDVSIAQGRILIAWTRAVTPAGTSVMLGSVGADSLGRSGQEGEVDTRFLERFGSAALISFIGAAPQLIVGDDGGSGEVVDDLGDDFRRSTRSTVDDYLSIPPSISVAQGEAMTVFVNRDLEFPG